jgi:hypothetical protein
MGQVASEEQTWWFLNHLARHVAGKLLVLWDGAPIHQSRVVKEYLSKRRGAPDSCGAIPGLCPRIEPSGRNLELLETGGAEEPVLPKHLPSQL